MKKAILLVGLCLLLLVGCSNHNIGSALKNFCISKGFDESGSLKDYIYEDTSIQCLSTSYLGFKIDKKEIFNISCTPDDDCLEWDMWGDCKKRYYNYTCEETK